MWRFGIENSPPLAFQWLRLPFGDRPAPYIATNSVRMLAEISRQSEPTGSKIIEEEMYMDDIGHSTATAEDAAKTKQRSGIQTTPQSMETQTRLSLMSWDKDGIKNTTNSPSSHGICNWSRDLRTSVPHWDSLPRYGTL